MFLQETFGSSAQQYKIENEQLTQKVEKCEVEINELVHINEVRSDDRSLVHLLDFMSVGTARRISSCTNSIRSNADGIFQTETSIV